MVSKFRSRPWDPMLITSQIMSMQFQFYSTFLLCNYIMNQFVNITNMSPEHIQYSLAQIFDHRLVNFKNSHNTFICFAYVANAFIR